MNKQKLLLLGFILFITINGFSQGFYLTQPKLELDGNKLVITYDLVVRNSSDKFSVWVEITDSNGKIIKAKSLSGDVGENVVPGNYRKIIWNPSKDSIFLNELVYVEVKAEKYNRAFNKGKMLLLSTVLPGWGQTKISDGNPWWLGGVLIYGTMVTGIIYNNKYQSTYKSYRIQTNSDQRSKLFTQAQNQSDISSVCLISAASAWVGNVLWIALKPNKYLPLEHLRFACKPSINDNISLLSFNITF